MIKNKNKVAIISTTLGSGGAERFAALLSVMLANQEFEVHNIVINDKIDYMFSGKLLNLGKLEKAYFFLPKKVNKGILLNRYLKENHIETIIDNRPRNNFIRDIIGKFIFGKRKRIYVIHSYNLDNYFPKSFFLAKTLYQNADKLICVSHAIEEKVKHKFGFKNTTTIHNPFDFSTIKNVDVSSNFENYILFFGRLDNKSKNFDLMLEAFSISEIYKKGYHLKILGDGPDLDFIQNKIKMLQLDNFVEIVPFTKEPFQWVKNAKYTILTSNYEGFPMSIVESLAYGTPVIAVDCNSGPREIIVHEQNGLLAEINNPKAFATAMNRMIDESDLYDFCKNNTSKSVEHLSMKTVSEQWKSILF